MPDLSMSFTPANWNQPQTCTVTGEDDAIADGSVSYSINLAAAVSEDDNYAGRDPADVQVVNLDNDSAGVSVSRTSGLITTEQGVQATFTVVLQSQPIASVSMAVASNDPTEGTVVQDSLIFTALNWNVPQTVTVVGVDDSAADGDIPYTVTIAISSFDPNYDDIDPITVRLTNIDDPEESVDLPFKTYLPFVRYP